MINFLLEILCYMKKIKQEKIKTISDFHRLRGLSQPDNPLISVVDYSTITRPNNISELNLMFGFYQISIKRGINAKLKYGQQEYDFDEGIMFFMAPDQVFSIKATFIESERRSGWMLLVHPDFLWHTSLAKTIKRYEFFDYAVNEALFLSEKEETIINNIILNIQQECHSNIDKYSKQIIISQIETLLNYSERFYHRQFLMREKINCQILGRLENLLNIYFDYDNIAVKGLPTVQYIAGQLNISPKYLSSLLKVLTGQNTQQHIHNKLIEKAKEKLSTTDFSVSEIAYQLGFEYPQSFSKLFKKKSGQSPLEFRASFN